MAVEYTEITSKEDWEQFIAKHTEANFLHSWNWGIFNQALGKKVIYGGFRRDSELIGVMLGVIEPAKRGRYLAIAGGPIIDFSDSEVVASATEAMRRLAVDNDCVFVRVRPQLEQSLEAKSLFLSQGFKPAQMHLEAELTTQLDITKSADELRMNMRKNTRYELKQAKKRQIKITTSEDPEDIKQFYELQLKTAERHGFVPFSYDRLHEEFKAFASDGQVLLYSAHTDDDKLIAQAFVVFYGAEASYHYGASTELGRDEPGAYLIQWRAILEAQKRGCQRYNFWGVVGPDETDHRFYGVSVFKRGFRGEDVEYLHAHDLVVSQAKYLKNFAVEFVRKRRRKV